MSAFNISTASKLSTVLSALRDVILSSQLQSKSGQHEPTPNEFFALLSTTLNTNIETEHLSELIQILASILPHCSKSIIQMQYKVVLPILLQLGNATTANANTNKKIIYYILQSIGQILISLEISDAVWLSKLSLQGVNALLGFIDDNNLKLRKVVSEMLLKLLQNHKNANYQSVRSYITDFCIEVMKGCNRSEYKRSLYILQFLESAGVFLIESKMLTLFQTMIKLQDCNQPILTAEIYRMIDCFYQSPYNVISATASLQLLVLLISNKPETADMEANTFYCTGCASIIVHINKTNPELYLEYTPRIISSLVQQCESEFVQIHCAVSSSLKRILACAVTDNLIKSALVAYTTGKKDKNAKLLVDIIQSVELLLQLRYQHAWIYLLDVLKYLFERHRGDPFMFMIDSLTKLSEMYHAIEAQSLSIDIPIHTEIGDSIGIALRSCGVPTFLSTCPFRLPTSETPSHFLIDDNREWILSIFQVNLKHMSCSLYDFGTYILAMISNYHHIIENFSSYNLTAVDIQKMRMRIIQLWSLFPEFCHENPVDIDKAFAHLPAIIDKYLFESKHFPEIQLPILQGLVSIVNAVSSRNVINTTDKTAPKSAEVAALQKYSVSLVTNLLKVIENLSISDILFNLYIQCIGTWIAITPKKTVDAIAKKLLQLLLSSTASDMDSDQSSSTASWMSVMIVLVPYLSASLIEIVYRSIRPLLNKTNENESVSTTIQKRAYHILEALLKYHSETIYNYEAPLAILAVVTDSLLTCHVSSRSIRLKCIEMLFQSFASTNTVSAAEKQSAIDNIFGEILICVKDSNKRTRDNALDLLKMILSKGSSIDLFTKLCAAIAADTSSMRSSALIGMCMLLLEKRYDQQLVHLAGEFLSTIALLLQDGNGRCSEQTRAVLSYVRVCAAVLPVDLLRHCLPQLIFCFTEGLADEKSKYLSRCRAIVRKLVHRIPDAELKEAMPASDLPLVLYVQRMNRRAQKKRTEAVKERLQRMLGSDSDDDSDDDADDNNSDLEDEQDNKHARPKATLASDVLKTFTTSLDDLLDESGINASRIEVAKTNKPQLTKRKERYLSSTTAAKNENSEENKDDDEFQVVVGEDGQVVVKQKEDKSKAKKPEGEDDEEETDNKKKPTDNKAALNSNKKRKHEPGEEYRSKKAGGDVWKKGMMQPHAFIPLNPRMLTNDKRREALEQLGSVVANKAKRKELNEGKSGVTGNRNQRRAHKEHSR